MAYRILAKADDKTVRATLHPGRNVIGSDPSCEVCLPNPTVSRHHASITVRPDGLELEDLGSRNGTLMRSRRIERARVDAGDIFVVGRAVLLIEEVAEDDLEVGLVLPRDPLDPSGVIAVRSGEVTEVYSPLDQFSLEYLPRLLEQLSRKIDRPRLAQQVGYALFDTLPATTIELVDIESPERGVLYSADRADGENEKAVWAEATAAGCQVRVQFVSPGMCEHFQPIIEAAVLMLALADRDGQIPTAVVSPTCGAERPQPPSVVPEMQRIYDQAERVARGDVGVLIFGESGTGKEVLARFIHGASPRVTRDFVAINCASLPRDLLEAELFGVEKGVATGVEARAGTFEKADQSTIFLDEIGDMSLETQAKILRVLQEREVFRIGGSTPRPARARVIAATNRPIHTMLAEGTFRSDLYHRIATWEVELPPLRRRRPDISNLAAYFLAREAKRYGVRVPGVSRAALRLLRRYRWPGNIRQLKNEIARAVLFLERGELLDSARLSPMIRGQEPLQTGTSLTQILETVERDEIIAALGACGGDTAATAERLQISRPTLYRRIKGLGIEVPKAK